MAAVDTTSGAALNGPTPRIMTATLVHGWVVEQAQPLTAPALSGRPFKHEDICVLQLNTQRLCEGMERGFCGATDWRYRHRHESEPGGDVNNCGSLLHLQVWQELYNHADRSIQINIDFA
jgi:hypothetical protein